MRKSTRKKEKSQSRNPSVIKELEKLRENARRFGKLDAEVSELINKAIDAEKRGAYWESSIWRDLLLSALRERKAKK